MKLKKIFNINKKKELLKKNEYFIIISLFNIHKRNFKETIKMKNTLFNHIFYGRHYKILKNLNLMKYYKNFKNFINDLKFFFRDNNLKIFLIICQKNYICNLFLRKYINIFLKKDYKYNFILFMNLNKIRFFNNNLNNYKIKNNERNY